MDVSVRMLRLLSLLQTRREWSGRELAQRLRVTERTVRRDIDRLRAMDYPVTSSTGTAGGYRMTAGAKPPPLLFDDEEAIAMAAGLLSATGGVTGVDDSVVRAVAKLEQVLPARLRSRVAAISHATVSSGTRTGPRVDPAVLATVAGCCRDQEGVRFDYRRRDGGTGCRRVEPHHLVTGYGLWYLVGYDLDRADWRMFRIDRLVAPEPTGRRFVPRSVPTGGPASYVSRRLAATPYRYTAELTVRAPAEVIRTHLDAPLPHRVREIDARSCRVRLDADSVRELASRVLTVVALGFDMTLYADPEIRAHLHGVARRLDALADGGTTDSARDLPGPV